MAFREDDRRVHVAGDVREAGVGPRQRLAVQGIASSPLIIDGVAYFTSNRGQIVAVDVQGFHDNENDGPYKDEKLTGQERSRLHLDRST